MLKRSISIFLIFVFTFGFRQNADAVAIPVAAIAAGGAVLLVAGAATYKTNPAAFNSVSSVVKTTGHNISVLTDAYYLGVSEFGKQQLYKDTAYIRASYNTVAAKFVELNPAASAPPVVSPEGNVTRGAFQTTASQLMSTANSNPSRFPKIYSAANIQPLSSAYATGSVATINGNKYVFGGYTYYNAGGNNFCNDTPTYWKNSSGVTGVGTPATFYVLFTAGSSSTCYQEMKIFSLSSAASNAVVNPVPTAATPQKFASNLANSAGALASPANVFSDKYAELDDYIKNYPGNVSVVDSPTARESLSTAVGALPDGSKTAVAGNDDESPPYVPGAALPAGTSAGTQPLVTGLSGANTQAATQAATDAKNAVDAAKQALQNAQNQLAADPNNQALKDAVAAAEKTLADAEKEAAAADDVLTSARKEDKEVYNSPERPPRKTLNFNKWKQLLNIMANVWPFTLLASLSSYYGLLVSDPSAPSFDLPIFGTLKVHIDLSFFNPVAIASRWILSLLLLIASVQKVVNWWKGQGSGV